MTRRSGPLCLAVAWLSVLTGVSGQNRAGTSATPSLANGDWPHYTADIRGTKYSPLAQIDATNFGKLEVAWRFKTDILGPRPE
jgi:quinoprotein glucose dehydrogenase